MGWLGAHSKCGRDAATFLWGGFFAADREDPLLNASTRRFHPLTRTRPTRVAHSNFPPHHHSFPHSVL